MTTGGRGPGSSPDDELLSRLYERVTDLLAARFGADYDLAAGSDRFLTWLRQHTTADQTTLAAVQASRPGTHQARPGIHAAATAAAGRTEAPAAIGIAAWQDAEAAVCELYSAHYQSLVRLSAILVRDTATAEEVVQDAFVAMHGAWGRLRDTDKALSYLRQSVVNRSRSVLRHRAIVDKYAAKPAPDTSSAEQGVISLLERPAVIAALEALPARQREALVLRYYADLPEAQIANAMGISRAAVKSLTARGMTALRTALEQKS